MAILAGAGPMGLGAIDYALHCDRRPSLLVVTDIDNVRLKRAAEVHSADEAMRQGVELIYINTLMMNDPVEGLLSYTGGHGFDDVMVFAPVKQVVEQADAILGFDGCLNFFAGPADSQFSAELNFYNVHYSFTHLVGTSGGNTDDMRESLEMMGSGKVNPTAMITHIGGLDAVISTTKNLPKIPGGKKLIYTNISLPLTAIQDMKELGKNDPLFSRLAEIVAENKGLWSVNAENYLLAHANPI